MSNIHPGSPRDDADRSQFTVEDSGSTTDAADLVGGERARQGDADFADDGTRASSGLGSGGAAGSTGSTGGAHAATSADVAGASGTTTVDRSVDHAEHDHDHLGHDHDHDHVGHDHDHADHDRDQRAGSGGEQGGLGLSALDDGSIGHVFDQTNGVVEGLEGESDGSAEGDELSGEDRGVENPDLFHDADVRGTSRTDDSTGA